MSVNFGMEFDFGNGIQYMDSVGDMLMASGFKSAIETSLLHTVKEHFKTELAAGSETTVIVTVTGITATRAIRNLAGGKLRLLYASSLQLDVAYKVTIREPPQTGSRTENFQRSARGIADSLAALATVQEDGTSNSFTTLLVETARSQLQDANLVDKGEPFSVAVLDAGVKSAVAKHPTTDHPTSGGPTEEPQHDTTSSTNSVSPLSGGKDIDGDSTTTSSVDDEGLSSTILFMGVWLIIVASLSAAYFFRHVRKDDLGSVERRGDSFITSFDLGEPPQRMAKLPEGEIVDSSLYEIPNEFDKSSYAAGFQQPAALGMQDLDLGMQKSMGSGERKKAKKKKKKNRSGEVNTSGESPGPSQEENSPGPSRENIQLQSKYMGD